MACSPRPGRLAISFVDTFSTFQAKIRAFSSVLRLVGAILMCGYKSCSTNKLTSQIRGLWYGCKHHRTPHKSSSVSTERETVTLQFPYYICLSCQIKVGSCWQHDLAAKPTYLWVLFATDLYDKRSILFADTHRPGAEWTDLLQGTTLISSLTDDLYDAINIEYFFSFSRKLTFRLY
ncbi:hypothetical protein GWK47_007685 [Chionoecetes opilio]|uniref:Uncharacterized protein n=1 Tax=Chionoecetes opilio TaxID=41210 RepID=A0A8J5CRE3_CHIOP|nr:hypothetical protein GWK47_007685 [Chionoecetes opilio]